MSLSAQNTLAWVSAFAVLAATACSPAKQSVQWDVRVDADARTRGALLIAEIFADGCKGSDVVFRAEVERGADAMQLPMLSPGRYAFSATVRDADCAEIAYGCVEHDVAPESTERVVTEAQNTAPVSACPGQCIAGRCGAAVEDGGPSSVPDAQGHDAGTDASEPASPDAGPPDSGSPDAGPQQIDSCSVLTFGDSSYLDCRAQGNVTWSVARDECAARGYHLPKVDDAAENSWLVSTFGWTWLGLNDAAMEGTFVWEDGSAASYAPWSEGEPNNANGGEDCVWLPTWIDCLCSGRAPFVCEREL